MVLRSKDKLWSLGGLSHLFSRQEGPVCYKVSGRRVTRVTTWSYLGFRRIP